jgi:hypothetical protein
LRPDVAVVVLAAEEDRDGDGTVFRLRRRRSFVAQLDRLGLDEQLTWDPPPKDLVRPLLRQAQWLSGQWANPFRGWCTADLLAVDLAIAFVEWSRDFTDPGRWRALFDLREQLGDDAKTWQEATEDW